MNKAVLVPDSFKGTMSSIEICQIMEKAIKSHFPDCAVVSIPIADGGEGTVDSMLEVLGGEKIPVTVRGPYDETVDCAYGMAPDGVAIIEMAASAGLPLVDGNMHPERTTTYGVGQMILDAARKGCRKIILGLGGSSTNDGGAGAAAACGVRFFDKQGQSFIPVGGTLSRIDRIDKSGLAAEIRTVEIITMCDIDNPLYGEQGAAYVFAPQKGADLEMVEYLDQQLRSFADQVKKDLGCDIAQIPGAGAAGGMGGGMVAFFDSKLQMGIETILDSAEFDQVISDADLIFTGEGKIDGQSLRGKVVSGVARRAAKSGKRVVAVVGDIGDNIENAYDIGLSGIFSINRLAIDFSKAKARSKQDLALTMDNLIRFIKSMQV